MKLLATAALSLFLLAPTAHASNGLVYTNKDGDKLFLAPNFNGMTLELTRQVGGPGGISNEGVVPYPTVCRTQIVGEVTEQNAESLTYQAIYAVLVKSESDLQNCADYVEAFNRIAQKSGLSFTIQKSDYKPAASK